LPNRRVDGETSDASNETKTVVLFRFGLFIVRKEVFFARSAPRSTPIEFAMMRRLAMLEPANISVSETLRNGQRVEIRSQRPLDRKDLEAALARMSDESLRRRFFGAKRHFSEEEAEYFLDIDFVNHVALVAVGSREWQAGDLAPDATWSSNLGRPRWLSGSSINIRAKGSAPRLCVSLSPPLATPVSAS
jgi:hypothetical protein